MSVLYSPCKMRNPFKMTFLPFVAQMYRLRKGHFSSLPCRKKIIKKLMPGRDLINLLFTFFGHTKGQFLFCDKEMIAFNPKNTQFHALYFPEYEGGYEVETTALIDLIISSRPHTIFYDIGANWGYFSLFVSSSPGFVGEIHAFEPMPETFSDLKSTAQQASSNQVVNCHNIALSNEVGAGKMHFPDGLSSGKAMLTKKHHNAIEVRLETLDSINLPPPTLMKVDVEGFEAEVFMGGEKTLLKNRPLIIFESWAALESAESTLTPFKFLKDLGYFFYEPALLQNDHKEGPLPYLLGYTNKRKAAAEGVLGLVKFEYEQRFLLKDQLNIFCCHRDDLSWLNKQFRPS